MIFDRLKHILYKLASRCTDLTANQLKGKQTTRANGYLIQVFLLRYFSPETI